MVVEENSLLSNATRCKEALYMMNDLDMLFDAAEFEKYTASTFATLAADCGSEQLRQQLLQHENTIQQHQSQFAQLMAQLQGQRNPV
jgi:hypothetical protein